MTSPIQRTWVQVALGVIAGTIASVGIVAVTAAGFSLSFDAIRTVARASHIKAELDWMMPVAIDGAMAIASVTAIVMQRMGRKPIYPWIVVLANVLISCGCNALHAYQGGGEKPLPGGWAMAVSAIPAVNLALSLHLAIELVMSVVRRSEKAAEQKGTAEEKEAAPGFADFAPSVVHGGTQPQRSPATQVARIDPVPTFAPAAVQPSLNGSHPVLTAASQDEKPAPAQAEKPAAKAPASVPAKVEEKPVEKPAAKRPAPAKVPTHPLANDENESIRVLAKAFARNPSKKNAELAKLAKVSEGTANRYMPQIRRAAIDAANADADEERAQGPLIDLPTFDPQPHVRDGINGFALTAAKEN